MLASISGCCANWQNNPNDCAVALCECGQIIEEPCVEEPFAEEPFAEEPYVEEPYVEEPYVEEPYVEEPYVEEACIEGSCAEQPCEEEFVEEACEPAWALLPKNLLACRQRIIVGPPAVRYQPPMPPKFLAVPTQPVYTEVSPDAPTSDRHHVEVGFDHQLAFPGRD